MPLAGVDVQSASWLAGSDMQYRLAFAEPLQRRSYVESRWVAPPGELLEGVLAEHLQPIRGLALAHAVFGAFQVGLIDALGAGPRDVADLTSDLGLHSGRLVGLLDYLENEGLVERSGATASLTIRGAQLPLVRPWYELLVGGYSGTFAQLPVTLQAGAPYAGRDGARVWVRSSPRLQHRLEDPVLGGIVDAVAIAAGLLGSVHGLVSMAKHNYSKTTGVEPNLTFTPDGKWIIFSGNFHSPQINGKSITHVYAVEIAKAQ